MMPIGTVYTNAGWEGVALTGKMRSRYLETHRSRGRGRKPRQGTVCSRPQWQQHRTRTWLLRRILVPVSPKYRCLIDARKMEMYHQSGTSLYTDIRRAWISGCSESERRA